MISRTLNTFLLVLAMSNLLLPLAVGAEAPLPEVELGIVTYKEINPERKIGYTVGDILQRTIVLDIKQPYKLVGTSLPIVGYEKRWKNQLTGIELHQISHTQQTHANSTRHTLQLAYQVFTNANVAKHAALPQEYIQLVANGKIVQYRIPSWDFVISPLSLFGSVKIEYDMSPLRGPWLQDKSAEILRLKFLLGGLALALFGLLYIFGQRAWLPRMGGQFARTYRQLRKLPDTPEGARQAVSLLHQALNTSAGYTVFGNTVENFLKKNPTFMPLTSEFGLFFAVSQQLFFETPTSSHSQAISLDWLQGFCRRCRDCERGLIPEKQHLQKQHPEKPDSEKLA